MTRIPGKSDLAKAFRYGPNRWESFCLFLEDGRVAIDNNPAERGMRPIETAKMNGLNPQAYLADVLDRIHDHKIKPADRIAAMELGARSPATQRGRVMAATTYVCSIAHVACQLGEDLELLEAIVSNDDNLSYGNIVSVHIGPDDYITALTDGGVLELRDMLASARVSVEQWHSFLEDFVAEPHIIARVKDQPLR